MSEYAGLVRFLKTNFSIPVDYQPDPDTEFLIPRKVILEYSRKFDWKIPKEIKEFLAPEGWVPEEDRKTAHYLFSKLYEKSLETDSNEEESGPHCVDGVCTFR